METKYALLGRLRDLSDTDDVQVDIRDAPEAFATLTSVRQDLGATAVPMRAHHAAAYLLLKRFAETADLSAEEWARADAVALAETADYLGADERFMRRLVEISYNRLSLRRSFPAAFHARTQESQDKAAVRKAIVPPFSRLVRVPCGADSEMASGVSGVSEASGSGVSPGTPTLLTTYEGHMCVTPELREAIALPMYVEEVLRHFPEAVLAGGGALDAVVKNLHPGKIDADIFLWGVTVERANVVARAIVDGIEAEYARHFGEVGGSIRTNITGNAITITSVNVSEPDQELCLQIVLRLCGTPDEILLGFDIPASKVLVRWNPAAGALEAWCTRSWLVAVRAGAIWLSPDDQSCNYAQRVFKYWLKGFRVQVTGLDRRRVNSEVYNAPHARGLRGLARVLRVEHAVLRRGANAIFGLTAFALAAANEAPGGAGVSAWFITYALSRCIEREMGKLREPNSDYATEARGIAASLRYPALPPTTREFTWMVRDAGSQAPVSGAFNPCDSPFYEDACPL